MNNRNHVSLDTARKLKAAGFPQKTAYVWVHEFPVFNRTDRLVTAEEFEKRLSSSVLSGEARDLVECSAAPTAQEIADQLPPIVVNHFANGAYSAREYPDYDPLYVKADTLAEVLASLWLELEEAK